jgi:hypothetical protein
MALHNIQKYQPKFNESFLFDNNVWVLLFCPIANAELKKQKSYSSFFKEIKQRNIAIFINSLILSEFCNSWLRLEFNLWKKHFGEQKDFKRDFKPTQKYTDTISEIKNTVKIILSATERGTDNFSSINLDTIFNDFGNCDFNDSYYIELAKTNKWKIVTDDSDFHNYSKEIDIITANH